MSATTDQQLLAELDEERRACVQIDEIQRRTIEPGLMRLPVSQVSTAEDSNTVTIEVEHPVEGDVSFHLSKPTTWNPENELVQFLDNYGLRFSDVYDLQTRDVYVDCSAGNSRNWELAVPPEDRPSTRERAVARLRNAASEIREEFSDSNDKIVALWLISAITTYPTLMFFFGGAEGLPETGGEALFVAFFFGVVNFAVFIGVMMVAALIDDDFDPTQ